MFVFQKWCDRFEKLTQIWLTDFITGICTEHSTSRDAASTERLCAWFSLDWCAILSMCWNELPTIHVNIFFKLILSNYRISSGKNNISSKLNSLLFYNLLYYCGIFLKFLANLFQKLIPITWCSGIHLEYESAEQMS